MSFTASALTAPADRAPEKKNSANLCATARPSVARRRGGKAVHERQLVHHREHLRRRVVHGAKPLRGDLHPVSAVRCCDERRTPRGDARRSPQRKRVADPPARKRKAGFVRRDVARAAAAPLERRRGVPPPALHGRLELAVEPLPPELLARAVALLARAVRLAHHDAAAHRRRRLRGRPSRRVDDEHRAHRVKQRARVRARRRRRLKPLEPPFHDLRRDRERVRAPERGLQRRDVVHHAPETPHVRLVVVRLLLDHLRTRVRHRAHRGSSSPARFGAFLFVTLVYRHLPTTKARRPAPWRARSPPA
jgi:hypothetical protein